MGLSVSPGLLFLCLSAPFFRLVFSLWLKRLNLSQFLTEQKRQPFILIGYQGLEKYGLMAKSVPQ